MTINSIVFVRRRFLRRRYIKVSLSNGRTYKIKRSGAYAVVLPPCSAAERAALSTVYSAAWEWLNGGDPSYLDRGAKVACGRLVELIDWPIGWMANFSVEARLKYVVECFRTGTNIN